MRTNKMFDVALDIIYASIIHVILLVIIFIINGKRIECEHMHYTDRKMIIKNLLHRIHHWHRVSIADTDTVEKNLHSRLAKEYLDILSTIASDREIFEKAGENMKLTRDKINSKN